jgi:signal transduction histidine kinase
VQVSLTWDAPDRLVLSVSDDGCGFDPSGVSACHGLVMMSDYAEAIGGKAQLSSSPGRGTTVSLTLLLLPDLSAMASQGGEAKQLATPAAV